MNRKEAACAALGLVAGVGCSSSAKSLLTPDAAAADASRGLARQADTYPGFSTLSVSAGVGSNIKLLLEPHDKPAYWSIDVDSKDVEAQWKQREGGWILIVTAKKAGSAVIDIKGRGGEKAAIVFEVSRD